MTYGEAYNMPIWKRRWYIDRVAKEIKASNGRSKATSAEDRALANNMKPGGPQRTKRFT